MMHLLNQTFCEQCSTDHLLIGMVHCEHCDRGSTDIGQSNEECAAQREMVLPSVAARMKQSRELSRSWINPRDIWAFVPILDRHSWP